MPRRNNKPTQATPVKMTRVLKAAIEKRVPRLRSAFSGFKKYRKGASTKAAGNTIRAMVPKLTAKIRNMTLTDSAHPSSKRLAAMIANPSAAPQGFRVNNQDANLTATCNLPHYVELTASTRSNPTNITALPVTASQIFLFRDPVRAVVHFVANPVGAAWCYQGTFSVGGAEVFTWTMTSTATSLNFLRCKSLDLQATMPPHTIATTVGLQPHGPYLYPGIRNAQPLVSYIYMEAASSVVITLNATSSTAVVDVFLYPGSGVAEGAALAVLSFASGTYATFNATAAGYYRFGVVDTASTPAIIESVYFYGNADVFAHHPVPGFDEEFKIFQNSRINAASILVHPTAPPLYESGTISGNYIQSNRETLWTSKIGVTDDFNQHYKEVYGYASGMYGFLPTDDLRDLYLQSQVTVNPAGTLVEANFQLEADTGYISMLLNCSNQGNTAQPSAPSLEFLLTTDFVVEYYTRDMTRAVGTCTMRHTETSDAYDIVRGMRIFYENPMHLADIRASVSRGFNRAKSVVAGASKALGVAESVGKLLAPFFL